MTEYSEIEDISEIDELNNRLTAKLKVVLNHLEFRRINRESKPNDVYFRHRYGDKVLWWSPRPWIRKGSRPRHNNLFGYGEPGVIDRLISEVEFNVPLPEASY